MACGGVSARSAHAPAVEWRQEKSAGRTEGRKAQKVRAMGRVSRRQAGRQEMAAARSRKRGGVNSVVVAVATGRQVLYGARQAAAR